VASADEVGEEATEDSAVADDSAPAELDTELRDQAALAEAKAALAEADAAVDDAESASAVAGGDPDFDPDDSYFAWYDQAVDSYVMAYTQPCGDLYRTDEPITIWVEGQFFASQVGGVSAGG